jgi:collagenase-like PrtC family protease
MDGRLVVPTNWDPALLDKVSPLQPAYMYGSLPEERGMRTVLQLPKIDEGAITEFVQEAKRRGIKFLYVMNATCHGNREMSEEGRWDYLQRCQWILDAGFTGITLANPYVMELTTRHFPDLEMHVSLLTGVDEARKAQFFADMGATLIHLDPIVARDFRRLKSIRRAVDCKLSLVVNEGCVLHCPLRSYHTNVISHSRESIEGQYHVDYCYYTCAGQKLRDKSELLRMPWIRPEDSEIFLEAGIDHFKIAGREKMGGGPSSHTDWIEMVSNAYHSGHSDNVADLLVGLEGIQSLMGEASAPPPGLRIDSRALDGFMRYFVEGHCHTDCGDCTYCDAWARKAVSIEADPSEYLEHVDASLERIRDGSYWTRALEA